MLTLSGLQCGANSKSRNRFIRRQDQRGECQAKVLEVGPPLRALTADNCASQRETPPVPRCRIAIWHSPMPSSARWKWTTPLRLN